MVVTMAMKRKKPKGTSLFSILKPYKLLIGLLIFFALGANGINLLVPKLISHAIDQYTVGTFQVNSLIFQFTLAAFGIFLLTGLQTVIQIYASEIVGRDLRNTLAAKISKLSYNTVQKVGASKLLTNLTSDVDSVKTFVSQAIASIVSSVFLIIGASILLLTTNWQLGLVVLTIIPLIGGTFFFLFKKVRVLFLESQKIIDLLNKVINESIFGAAIIRVLNSQKDEAQKFSKANAQARDLGLRILQIFASLIPLITFMSSLAILAILLLGGRFVITGTLSLGNFTAFISYLGILIFPIILIGFMSNLIARSTASYQRIADVLAKKEARDDGKISSELEGNVSVKDVNLKFGEKIALKDVSFTLKPHTKNAIIGPTAAGKTQLLYILTGLINPDHGIISYDGISIKKYQKASLHKQIGFVFQDSIMFNMTIRENIAFSKDVTETDMQKAIETAELSDFIKKLDEGVDTIISERGTSLSGGQKQRIMLARALSISPKILYLDDFTARVDTNTEKKILGNIEKNYPDLTLLSVTQKIASVEKYDQILVLMEGEILAKGTHKELLKKSPEYVQIFNSQKSTNEYEL
jgi:ATP-binding cassette, subfamily B, bacterial